MTTATNRTFQAVRIYPSCCTSMFCGRSECEGCKNEPILRDFEAWREATKAVRNDPIWCPTVWQATVEL